MLPHFLRLGIVKTQFSPRFYQSQVNFILTTLAKKVLTKWLEVLILFTYCLSCRILLIPMLVLFYLERKMFLLVVPGTWQTGDNHRQSCSVPGQVRRVGVLGANGAGDHSSSWHLHRQDHVSLSGKKSIIINQQPKAGFLTTFPDTFFFNGEGHTKPDWRRRKWPRAAVCMSESQSRPEEHGVHWRPASDDEVSLPFEWDCRGFLRPPEVYVLWIRKVMLSELSFCKSLHFWSFAHFRHCLRMVE